MEQWKSGDIITAGRLNGMIPVVFTYDWDVSNMTIYLLFNNERVTYNTVKSIINNGVVPFLLDIIEDPTGEQYEFTLLTQLSKDSDGCLVMFGELSFTSNDPDIPISQSIVDPENPGR